MPEVYDEWNAGQMGWHERVHKRLGENLYYFFLKVSPLDTLRVQQEIAQLLSKHSLGSLRAFEIFGAYDLLIRVWLHPNILNDFNLWLRETLRESLRTVHTFEADSTEYRWYKACDARVLAHLDENTIRAAQQKGSELDHLVASGVVTFRERTAKQEGLIRFFTSVYLEYSSAHQETAIGDLIGELSKDSSIKYLTVDRGFGFCSYLIKGESSDFFAIARIPPWISRHFRAHRVTTETFLCHAALPLVGGEMIGEATFRAMAGKDLFVYSLLPELYELDGFNNKSKREITAFLTNLRGKTENGLTLTDRDKALIHETLYGYLRNSPTDIAKALFGLFADVERYIRNTYKEALGRAGVLKRTLQSPDPSPELKKHVSLGDMLTALHKGGELLRESRLQWECGSRFANLRNVVMHGALESISLCELDEIIDCLPGLRRLLSVIEELSHVPYVGV